ncbi:monovalent cation/H+ antiporter subunit D [Ramlibacter sp. Leaf400]|uniref:monovalent cation/H+ antiporter subunit D n=1 Tax=Ramlibacter sp. Leaf400 TaxID=1736365 RepID=UPI00070007BC|nr:monovalent cation/H+ antiporter subunit D [Ramlibacter sp. Leaf400]KQT13337.1 cation:proton antiporter [Ramlibacter sp. Leaf400]
MNVPGTAHLLVLPVLLPLLTAAVLIAMGDRWRRFKALLNLLSVAASLALAVLLAMRVGAAAVPDAFVAYLPGNWPVPFGIVLVLDRLSALMLVLAAAAALAALLFSLARWHRASVNFHPLLQLQLMGLNGAFLTADLFNLFVFFEVLLAASYGLVLHGGGTNRVRAGLHYIAVNLLASLLFLVGVAVLYGVTGTLNMADMANKLPQVPLGDRGLLHAGAALLGVAFLAKAALWPLNFWLPSAYAAASAPAAAMFAVLTKVGIYAVLRLWTLCFPATAGDSALYGGVALLWGGLFTAAFGAIGMLSSQQLGRLGGYSVITTSGILLAAMSLDLPEVTGAALLYLASSTLGAAALFLLVELVERGRQLEVEPPSADEREDRLPSFAEPAPADANLDDQQVALVGRAIPASMAFLGVGFLLCTLVLAGLPPLSGFVGKVAMIDALLDARGSVAAPFPAQGWHLFALLIASGLLAAVAFTRAFIAHFWALQDRAAPRLRVIEGLPIALLLAACLALAFAGDRALGYLRGAAEQLHSPDLYIRAVLGSQPVPPPRGGER